MELKLTDEMIMSIKKDVIPRLKFMYDIGSKEQLDEKIDEIDIDWVDVFQVSLDILDGLKTKWKGEVLSVQTKQYHRLSL